MGLWLDRGRECDNLHQAIEIQIIQYLCGTDSPVSVALNTPLDRPIDRALRGFFIRFCYPSVTRPPKWRLLVTNKPIYHSELQPILERSNRFCIGKGLLCDNPCDNEGNLIMPSIIKESSLTEIGKHIFVELLFKWFAYTDNESGKIDRKNNIKMLEKYYNQLLQKIDRK